MSMPITRATEPRPIVSRSKARGQWWELYHEPSGAALYVGPWQALWRFYEHECPTSDVQVRKTTRSAWVSQQSETTSEGARA